MGSPILTLANDAADELSLRPVLTLFGPDEGDSAPRKLRRALTKTCQHIAGRYDWPFLRREHRFVTTPGERQDPAETFPADFERHVMGTAWDRTNARKVIGPLSPQDWQASKAFGHTASTVMLTERDGAMYLTPAAVHGGALIAYEYISNGMGVPWTGPVTVESDPWLFSPHTSLAPTDAWTYPVESGADSGRLVRFALDRDTTLWDDELITLGIVAYWRQAEGLDGPTAMLEFERMLAARIKRAGGRRMLDMGAGRRHGCGNPLTRSLKQNVTVHQVNPDWEQAEWGQPWSSHGHGTAAQLVW